MENLNQIKDDATKAFVAVAEFIKQELGIDIDEEEIGLEGMYEQIETFLSELKEKDPSKTEQFTKKYEELKNRIDETFGNLAKHANELYEKK